MGERVFTGIQQAFGAAGCPFGTETLRQLNANATLTLGGGAWLVVLSANDFLEYTPDAGTTWRTLVPAGSASPLVFSDGFNLRIHNSGVADAGAVGSYTVQVLAYS